MKKNRTRKIVLWCFIGIAVYSLLGFFVVPLALKPLLTDKLSEVTSREVSIEKIRVNPFALSITLRNLKINKLDDSEPLGTFSELYANLQVISAFKRALIMKEFRLTKPSLYIERNKEGIVNLTNIFGKGEEAPSQNGGSEKGIGLTIYRIDVTGGNILFNDAASAKPFQTILDPIDITVLDLSTEKDKRAAFVLSVKSEAREEVKVKGSLSLDPFVSEGSVEINDLSGPKYSPYYEDAIAFDIENVTVSLRTEYRYDGRKESTVAQLANLNLSLREILLRQGTNEFFKVGTLLVENTDIDLNKKTIEIGNMSTSKGELTLVRESDGILNVSTLVHPADGEEELGKKGNDRSPWIVTVKTLSTDGYALTFEDRSTDQSVKVKLKNVDLAGENISTVERSRGRLSLDLQEELGGTFSTDGTVGVNPLFADFSVKLSDFHITPLQPYVSEVADLILQKGAISTEGNLIVEEGEGGTPSVSLKTDVALVDFSSVDSAKGDDFFACTSLRFDALDLSYNPNRLKVNEISLSDFYARIIINSDQTLNTSNIFKGSEKENGAITTETKKVEREDATFFESTDLGTVRLKNGRITFSDLFITPNYTAHLSDMEGDISGLTSEESKVATVNLRGKLNKTVPLKITGKTNPLKEDFFADLNVEFENIELSPLTPYSQKYLGYPIDKGKLFLNLQYKIDKRTIDSENKIFIDQFTLGEAVESPDSMKLPVKLALSLLQDRNGEIDLDVPVSGSIDDPEFSVGYFIFKIIGNIIEKAVTSPFALIGSLAGGGEELGYVEFDYGSVIITDKNAEKLNKLNEALYSRPLLKLEIEGHVDTARDRETLKEELLLTKIKAAKLKDNASKGLPPLSLEEIQIGPEEYETYLAMAYKEEGLPTPEGEQKADAMEKGLLDIIIVTDEDLRQLAYTRASEIRDYMLDSGKVEKERIFLLEPKSLMPEKRENIKDSRVDFHLK
jgi:hypothetical protein